MKHSTGEKPKGLTVFAKVSLVFIALVAIPASWIGLAALGFPVAGIDLFKDEEETAQAQNNNRAQRASLQETPADVLFRGVMGQLDTTWDPSPLEVTAAGLPHPLDCVTPAPALSASKAYTVENAETQVTLAAYPAGLGAEMYSRFVNDVYECKPSTTSVFTSEAPGLGVEATTMAVSWNGNAINTTIFRRGDVLAFVATDAEGPSAARATVVDGILNQQMPATVCLKQDAPTDAATRNAMFAENGFTGLQKIKPLKTEKLSSPNVPAAAREAGVTKTKPPGKTLEVPEVVLPSDDYPYPLWPLLPPEVNIPEKPSAPKPQKLKSKAEIRIEDKQGPGCGWAFLATVQPTFDQDEVEASNQVLIDSAQDTLDADGPRWQRALQRFWNAYASYSLATEDYRSYAAEVDDVAIAWEEIHEDWDAYYTAYANWEEEVSVRDTFIANQDQARIDYQDAQQACRTYNSDLQEYNTAMAQYDRDLAQYDRDLQQWQQVQNDGNPNNNYPRPERPDRPERPLLPVGGCPPLRPAILDETAPEVSEEPAQPADPRPPEAR